ncbi:MAG: hypothetical protein KF777_00450 [Planctomycetaceae bacterium]|nr:hypothetical protein [Planctomycetaceae bacterium]
MVDFDLGALSAPIEALRSDVNEAYKRLDERWNEVSSALKKLPIPCSVSTVFDQDEYGGFWTECLEWRKWKGSWRLCIVSYVLDSSRGEETKDVVPYEEWSAEHRLNLLNFVPSLFENAAKQTKQFISRTSKREVRK